MIHFNPTFRNKIATCVILLTAFASIGHTADDDKIEALNTPDVQPTGASVTYLQDLDLVVFEFKVAGTAGKTTPEARGQMDGAPVLAYVFPTTLHSEDVGFSATEGIVALAVTSHPDFDDTPLWDENNDFDNTNDGIVFHSHWVVLTKDERVPGGLSAKPFDKDDKSVTLPATNPGMPLYFDSPGYSIVLKDKVLKVLVPAQRVNHKTSFNFDAVTAYLEVSTSGDGPMLGVYRVFGVLSGDLSLPYKAQH